ncbi:MAG: hypothetical protein IPH07_24550 [Deltaproteobacteria bacterium]|nr:hypothetical protein [Deltaproteobacteria bacterium]
MITPAKARRAELEILRDPFPAPPRAAPLQRVVGPDRTQRQRARAWFRRARHSLRGADLSPVSFKQAWWHSIDHPPAPWVTPP